MWGILYATCTLFSKPFPPPHPCMKFTKLLICAAASVTALTLCASAQTSVANMTFSGLYSNNPATFISGTGVLGETLTGDQFHWVCLDQVQDAPGTGSPVSYTISTDPSVMQAGFFGSSGHSALHRQEIIDASVNMYYAFESQLQPTSSSAYASAYQSAVWAVTGSYQVGLISGSITTATINDLIAYYDPYIQDEPLIEDFLLAALTAPTGSSTVYFGNPTSNSDLQPVLFFPVGSVPEPSTLTLTGMLGFFFIMRRRRA